ncbi:hypothetical protein [Pseudophaeobacter sp.]|uniref:hypothetical protein n=1 Tax=Pseudophaeobacter sp. TaxID=1971739 RepID=UPI004058A9F2
MQQGLSLPWPAAKVAGSAICPNLSGMARKSPPAGNLLLVDLGQAATQVEAAIPLKPATRIWPKDPAFFLPVTEGLAAFDAEMVEAGVGCIADPCLFKPGSGQLIPAIVAILALKDAQFQHLLGGELRFETVVKYVSGGCG